MQKVKWIFFAYLAFVVLIVAGIAVSFTTVPPRDPHTLYSVYLGSVKTLDPAEVNDTIGAPLVGQIFECLYNYKYEIPPYQIVPEIAATMPRISADGLVMTIPIRRGIHFFDPDKVLSPDGVGPEIKAADVIYSFKRMCDFNLASANYSSTFEGQIAGLDDWWNYTKRTSPADIDWDRPVTGFTALDDYTVRLTLTQPDPQLIYILAHEPTSIVCRAVVKKWGPAIRRHPVGSGPYYLAENLPEQRIIMQANPIYRGASDMDAEAPIAAADRLPHVKRMEFDYFSEPLPVWLLFTEGFLDIAGIPKESFTQTVRIDTGELTPALKRKGIVLQKFPYAVTEYIGFNMQDPIVGKNKPLRQAMSMAFDRATYVQNFENGRGLVAIGPIPPGFPTFDPHQVNPNTQFNLSLAREKMKEAIRINGGPIPPLAYLMRDADTLSRQMADNMVGQMREIGVELRPEFRDWARWQEMVDNRQTQVFDAGWEADYPDEQNFFQLFYGKNVPAGGVNSSAYINPEFDRLYEQASIMSDSPERRDIYRKMSGIVMEDCPWLIEFYPILYQLTYDWLQDYHYMDYGHGYRGYVKLDEGLRRRRLQGN